ncbi:MAG: HAMP domain-containing histidine kinase [Sphingobacteriales bacterium]|nr:MAG: HAMP domain-containing histidine kinase [Sphingobacteriales bacterium]
MPIRLRITLLYSLIVFVILGLVCGGTYYISTQARVRLINSRLENRAFNTARLLSRDEVFNRSLVLQIDSLSRLTYSHKIVQAYSVTYEKVYSYTDQPGDTLRIERALLQRALNQGPVYFTSGNKEGVVVYYNDAGSQLLMVSAGDDIEGKASLQRLSRILLLVFFGGNLLVLLSGYAFSYRLLRPVRRITADVAEISAQNLTRRLEAGKTNDEWSQLANTLNELLNRLQDSFDMQRRFISNASHELSTPLTSISSQLEIALQRERAADDYRQVMRSIYQDVQHMSKLTQTLLEFAKASGNTGGLDIELLRIDELLLRLPAEVVKASQQYQVQLHFDELPDEASQLLVYGNEALLFTAFRNIVLNACKYSDDHLARVYLRAGAGRIEVDVEDRGRGISAEHMEQIFHPFYRVEENLQGGFGLGLSLASRIVGLHKGHISVFSEPGKGARFSIVLHPADVH